MVAGGAILRNFEKRFFDYLATQSVTCKNGLLEAGGSGASTYYFDFSPSNPSGLTILAHGTGNDALYPQLNLVDSLLRVGQRVIAFDLDGHGFRSTSKLGDKIREDTIGRVIDYVVSENIAFRPNGVGISLGGVHLMQAAKQYDFERLLFISLPIRVNLGLLALLNESKAIFDRRFYRQVKWYGFMDLIPAMGPFRRGEFPIRIHSHNAMSYPKHVARLIEEFGVLEKIRGLQLSTKFIYGSNDRIAYDKLDLAEINNSTKHEITLISGATHLTTCFSVKTEKEMSDWVMAE